jgi:hypothetical protein
LQDTSQISGDNLKNVRRGTSRIFREKEGICEGKTIKDLEINSKNKISETYIEGYRNLKGLLT